MSTWAYGPMSHRESTRKSAGPARRPARARLGTLLVVCGALLVLAETDAHAYADPGSGTLLLQMAFAAFFGLMFYVRRIVAWIRRRVGGTHDQAPTAAASSETGSKSSDATGDR